MAGVGSCLTICALPTRCPASPQVVRWTWKTGGTLTFILLIAWPLLTLPAKVFTKGYFTFWVILSMIWGLGAAFSCIVLPVYEAIIGLREPTPGPIKGGEAEERD